jgi:hypothetical protein
MAKIKTPSMMTRQLEDLIYSQVKRKQLSLDLVITVVDIFFWTMNACFFLSLILAFYWKLIMIVTIPMIGGTVEAIKWMYLDLGYKIWFLQFSSAKSRHSNALVTYYYYMSVRFPPTGDSFELEVVKQPFPKGPVELVYKEEICKTELFCNTNASDLNEDCLEKLISFLRTI